MRSKRTFIFLAALALILLGLIVIWLIPSAAPPKPLTTVALGDRRILQIEAVTYGTNHHVGKHGSEVIRRLGRWLPRRLLSYFDSKYPESVIEGFDRPALVVWVNAVSEDTGTNVDCQGIRVELVDEHGQHFAETTSSWSASDKFSRVGHTFEVYPRNESKLTMEVTTWEQNQTNHVVFANPQVIRPAAWRGLELPQQKPAGDFTVMLKALRLRTNSVPPKYWETREVYWEPLWEMRQGSETVAGWTKPEWFAEDPLGNLGKQLGTNQPVLRFSATFYPNATNALAAIVIAVLPKVAVSNLQSVVWWNQAAKYEAIKVSILGLFPHGSYVFSDGVLLTNSPVSMSPVRGGAPSGWHWTSRPVSPLKDVHYSGHYSLTNNIIYVSAPKLDSKIHLAMRLRDDQSRTWAAKPDPGGADNGIYPFLINLPPEVNWITPELVALKPVHAEFTVKVPTLPGL